MADVLESSALDQWQREPIRFIEQILRNPETGKPFELLDAERAFLTHAYQTDESGRLVYPEQLYACPKKSGKTGFAAMHLLTTTLVFGGRFAEAYAVANDLEQAQGRVFLAARRICEASPYLRREATITQSRIDFPEIGATITAIGSDYAGAAGTNPVISSFDDPPVHHVPAAALSSASRTDGDLPADRVSCRRPTSSRRKPPGGRGRQNRAAMGPRLGDTTRRCVGGEAVGTSARCCDITHLAAKILRALQMLRARQHRPCGGSIHSRTRPSKRRCRMTICSHSVRRTMSSGSTNSAKSGRFSTSSLMRASNLVFPAIPTLRPKLRKVPRRSFSMKSGLFDHFVGGGEQDWRNANAERLRGLEINYQLKPRRLFDR